MISLLLCMGFKKQEYTDGTFIYDVYFAEWNRSMGDTVRVTIQGNRIKVIFEKGNITGLTKGRLLDEGILYKHKSGQWIITKPNIPDDIDQQEVGGCSAGHTVIDIKNKIYWLC